MSTALSPTTHPGPAEPLVDPKIRARHLRSVSDADLSIQTVSTLPSTDIRQAARLGAVALDPREEFAPSDDPHLRVGHSHVFARPETRRVTPIDHRQTRLLADIKKMTQTIGSAFIEAELGIRPFSQLGSWLEHELFHKFKSRVQHSARAKHVAARRGEEASRKVPSITPIGVRAAMRRNGEWESSMTIRVGDRARAIAMRLQLHRDRWRVIALEVG